MNQSRSLLKKSHLVLAKVLKYLFFAAVIETSLFASEDKQGLALELQVDPYFQALVKTQALSIESGSVDDTSVVSNDGGLFFGQWLGGKNIAFEGHQSSFSSFTKTSVQIINNHKPFKLMLRILPTEGKNFILDLLTVEKKCALHLRVSSSKETKDQSNLFLNSEWTPFDELGEMVLYDSGSKTISDQFEIELALLDLTGLPAAGIYGGEVEWLMVPTV